MDQETTLKVLYHGCKERGPPAKRDESSLHDGGQAAHAGGTSVLRHAHAGGTCVSQAAAPLELIAIGLELDAKAKIRATRRAGDAGADDAG